MLSAGSGSKTGWGQSTAKPSMLIGNPIFGDGGASQHNVHMVVVSLIGAPHTQALTTIQLPMLALLSDLCTLPGVLTSLLEDDMAELDVLVDLCKNTLKLIKSECMHKQNEIPITQTMLTYNIFQPVLNDAINA